jgi:uncharacterized protein YhfF
VEGAKIEHKSVREMWINYLKSIGEDITETDKRYNSWHFCDNEMDANELAELTKQGVKRATTGLYYSYTAEGEAVPETGDLNIITDWDGEAQCIIETEKVDILPFKEVTEEFADTEGEGDKSLRYWREAHIKAFTRELKECNREFNENMLVVCETFKVVYM